MNDMYSRIFTDCFKKLNEIDIESYRYLVIFVKGTKALIKNRKELRLFIDQYEAEIDEVIEITNKSDRYLDYETRNRYRVDVNALMDDQWYCEYVDEQCRQFVMAPDTESAMLKAIEKTKSIYSGNVDVRFKPVNVEKYDSVKKEWKKVSFKWTE